MTAEFIVAIHAIEFLNHKKAAFSSEEIAQNVCTNPARVRKVLLKLKAAGLVRGEVDGPRTCYCIDRQGMARLRELAAGLLPEGGGEAGEIGEDCPCALDSGEEAS